MKSYLFDEILLHTPKIKKRPRKKLDYQIIEDRLDDKSDYIWNLVILGLSLFSVYLIFIARAAVVQISKQDNYLDLARRNRIREFSILPGRGLIYDTNEEVIVRNKPSFSVILNPLLCDAQGIYGGCSRIIEEAQKYIQLDSVERIKKEIAEDNSNILLAASLTKDKILSLEANLKNLPGISIEVSPARDYLYDYCIAHVIGYVGIGESVPATIEGKIGIEKYYNKDLSGVSGTKIVQVNSNSTEYKVITYEDPLPGKDITLYLDIKLQQLAYSLLEDEISGKDNSSVAGVVVASDPFTGGILALVSYPSFDPNKISSGISWEELKNLNNDPHFPFFNRAISAVYPPGSTFKMVAASAALMENVTNEYLTIYDNGYIQVGSFIFKNWKLDGHGDVNLVKALQVSNDTYFYTMGGGYNGIQGLGISKMHDWAQKFGYGSILGVDLYGEEPGYMPDGTTREWYLGDDYITAIGQGDILATPLQVNSMTSYFANGGYLLRPRIVKNIDGVGDTKKQIIKSNLIDNKSYDLIRKGLNLAVEFGGTGYPLFDFAQKHDGIKLAGKTGTAEYINSEGKDSTHAWFTVFGPYYSKSSDQTNAENIGPKPIVITVFLEGGESGADNAAPIARKLLDFWFEKEK